ncbi:MAG: radical SAM protein [Candidatus Magnetoovum sp. WYHC-5]|nr:radical SAM protein [Candidatus Magnetoovum sp. WYHC-5]
MSNIKYYDFIAADITNICNLRCPYCLNDWTKVGAPKLMDEITFLKVTSLLPLLDSDASFYFSCLFEPTIHPNMISLIKMVPLAHRKKVFFTTNLTFPLPDELIGELANLDIHHINISLDSLDPQVFKTLRKGANFHIFIDNLKRLTNTFRKIPHSPPIHYITVISKNNLKEVPIIVEKCATEYLAALNEVRTFSVHEHMNKAWVSENSITYEEYLRLRDTLSKMPYKWESYYPQLPHKWTTFYTEETEYDKFYRAIKDQRLREIYYVAPYKALRVDANGYVELFHIGVDVKFDLKEVKAPYDFFKNILTLHCLDVDRAKEIKKLTEEKISLSLQNSQLRASAKSQIKYYLNKIKHTIKNFRD